ncbi:unnamed protein product [Orchesella dallaii]|uniref:Gustatory receptor n=1 Tax=Orchesella dallaii TaxID=48710 RepID=A0ABP1R766_9HEXA
MEKRTTASNTAENAVTTLLELPLLINHLSGLFPLTLDKSKLNLNTTYRSYCRTFIIFGLVCICPTLFHTLDPKDLLIVYKLRGPTEMIIATAANNFTSLFDFICLCHLFRNRFKIRDFYTSFLKAVIKVLELSYTFCPDEVKVLQNQKKKLHIFMGITFALGVFAAFNSTIFYCGKAIQAGMTVRTVVTFFLLTMYWIIVNHFRMLSFYLWIALILCFKEAFRALGGLINSKSKEICIQQNRIYWVIEIYHEIEEYLQEFHKLFGIQLLNLCFTSVVPLENVIYQVLKCFIVGDIGPWELSTLASLSPHILSGVMTFFILCDAATSMTIEATNVANNFRFIPSISEMPVSKQENALGILTKSNTNATVEPKRLVWIIENYNEIEIFLKEFHQLFGLQLYNMCIAFLFPVLNTGFEFIKVFRSEELGSWELAAVIGGTPHLISVTIPFFLLCDASTAMSNEALTCVTNFRGDISPLLSETDTELKDQIFMFYSSTLANPPRIRPGNFFSLGRHILPTVLGLMTTYLIVLQQFVSQEQSGKLLGKDNNSIFNNNRV